MKLRLKCTLTKLSDRPTTTSIVIVFGAHSQSSRNSRAYIHQKHLGRAGRASMIVLSVTQKVTSVTHS